MLPTFYLFFFLLLYFFPLPSSTRSFFLSSTSSLDGLLFYPPHTRGGRVAFSSFFFLFLFLFLALVDALANETKHRTFSTTVFLYVTFLNVIHECHQERGLRDQLQ